MSCLRTTPLGLKEIACSMTLLGASRRPAKRLQFNEVALDSNLEGKHKA